MISIAIENNETVCTYCSETFQMSQNKSARNFFAQTLHVIAYMHANYAHGIDEFQMFVFVIN